VEEKRSACRKHTFLTNKTKTPYGVLPVHSAIITGDSLFALAESMQS
jgi:hypothetical protein